MNGFKIFTSNQFRYKGFLSIFTISFLFISVVEAQTPRYVSAPDELTIVITHGQSLSIGLSNNSSIISKSPGEYPTHALTLQTGNAKRNSLGWQNATVNPSAITNFTPFFQSSTYNEGPGSGVISSLINNFDSSGIARPTFLHINGGHGGRAVGELMLRSTDFYSSVSAGLAATPYNQPFVVYDSATKKYFYYLNKNNTAVTVTAANSVKPVYYNNILEQVKKAVIIANSKNLRINPHVFFVWIQGQADSSNSNYQLLLTELLRRLEVDLQGATGLGANLKFHSFLSQLRGIANKDRAIDMIQVANDVSNSHFAAQESWISNAFALTNSSHLLKVGYRLLGEQIGNSIFQVMMSGQEAVPAVTNLDVNGRIVTLTFGGLRGNLIDDPSIHQNMGYPVPPHFGCALYTTAGYTLSGNSIVASRIVGANQIELTLQNNISGSFYLYLGRNNTRLIATSAGSAHAATTLRDSVQDFFVGASLSPVTMFGQNIPRFAPIQRFLLTAGQTSYSAYTGLVTPEP